MLGLSQRFQRGDTIVEVMFAVAVFSLIAVGTISIMNLGTNNSLRALETAAARQAVDAESASLQFMHDSYVAQYKTGSTVYTGAAQDWYNNFVVSSAKFVTTPTSYLGSVTCPTASTLSAKNTFVVDPTMAHPGSNIKNGTSIVQAVGDDAAATPYPQMVYTAGAFKHASGIWIQAQKGTSGGVGYVDFYITTCWPDPASDKNAATLGTIVRLYVPA